MPASDPEHTLIVTAAESGQKLLQYLIRRLSLSQSMLHRWIRTGQIRVNGGRGKPFNRVQEGDNIRLPPFALKMAAAAQFEPLSSPNTSQQEPAPASPFSVVPFLRSRRFGKQAKLPEKLEVPPLLCQLGDIWAYDKPAGLPVQPGTGHADSMATRLAAAFAQLPFLPTPAHRLDKDTSGILLVGASYTALRSLQDAFRTHTIGKEYLAWVEGAWAYEHPLALRHLLAKKYTGYFERVAAGAGKEAICIVAPLHRTQEGSLLHIRLITGRTHQIRAQLAACGHPLMGDVKYGGSAKQGFWLHACRLMLPPHVQHGLPQVPADRDYLVASLPPWDGCYAVQTLPPPLTDTLCQGILTDFQ